MRLVVVACKTINSRSVQNIRGRGVQNIISRGVQKHHHVGRTMAVLLNLFNSSNENTP